MNKFVLIAQQGSGTHLLRALLNSHPEIYCDEELFVQGRSYGEYWIKKNHLTIPDYLNWFYNKKHNKKIIGFDLKYNQLNLKNDEIVYYLNDNNIKVLHLLRDPVRTFFRSMNKKNNTSYNYKDIKNHCDKIRTFDKLVETTFGYDKDRYQQITYEELTLGREINEIKDYELLSNLQIYLGVDKHEKLTTKGQVMRKPLINRF